MSCSFEGAVELPDICRQALGVGADLIDVVPLSRWDVTAIYDPQPGVPDKTYVKHGGFLKSADLFDNLFFGI